MKAPVATYRVQLNKNFDFEKLKAIIPYLAHLGISHIYASPIFMAKKGSLHGYDIVNPKKISDELGGEKAFDNLTREAAAYKLEWLQDIVPNHASYSLENKMIYDLMEKGSGSKYHGFFDVDWSYPSPKLRGRLLAPFLEKSYQECLKQGELSLIFNKGFKVRYNSNEFPINVITAKLNNAFVKETIDEYKKSPELLDKLLSTQIYALSHWKTALKRINYRRFFDIIDLMGLRMEDPTVFQETHRLTLQLLALGKISALRVDHIDGLFNPEEYIEKLRQLLPDTYIVVEKILTDEENLPRTWQVQGTTGYEFLNHVNGLFVKDTGGLEIDRFYRQFTGNTQDFSDLLHECKKFIVKEYFLGDVRNLARLINQSLGKMQYGGKVDSERIMQAVIELLACFPVYRTYLDQRNTQATVKVPFIGALKAAEQRNPALADVFASFYYLLAQCEKSEEALRTVMRLQQFTGAIMAKGFEDTAFYRYNRFLPLNEVGSNPEKFGCSIEEFHKFNQYRQRDWPLSLNATSTHDTKRGEDVRARLNVLSEIPLEFQKHVKKWSELNADKKTQIDDRPAPDRNEEYYIYQTLLGAFPFNAVDRQEFTGRLKVHMTKALREAKKHSSWVAPDMPYEEATTNFASEVLESESFLTEFLPFQKKIACSGFFNSLAQVLLKVTCPGVPDFYQGTELWDLNLVDPDNRRPVDYQIRQQMLADVSRIKPSTAGELWRDIEDGKAKMYVTFKSLEFRKEQKDLFEDGTYVPLAVEGQLKEHVVAFCRQKDDRLTIVVVPMFLTNLIRGEEKGEAGIEWGNTALTLPMTAPTVWKEVFTGKSLNTQDRRLPISEVLSTFPAALLHSGDING